MSGGLPLRGRGEQARARFVVLHGLAVATLVTSLLTGLRIHASNRALDAPGGWTAWLPNGAAHAVHLGAALVWLVLLVAYLLHRRAPGRAPAAWPARPLGGPARWVNRALIRLLRHVVLGLLVSGAVVYVWGAGAGRGGWVQGHSLLAWLLAGAVLAHGLAHGLAQAAWGAWPQVRALLLWQPGRAGWLQARLAVPLLLVAVVAASGGPGTPGAIELTVHEVAIDTPFSIDGRADEPAWQQAVPVTVQTTLPGEVPQALPVTVQALRQGEVMQLLISWPDASPSLQHLPLVKTATGWQVQHEGVLQHDERRFYEDKFALLWSPDDRGVGGGSVRLGGFPGLAPAQAGPVAHDSQAPQIPQTSQVGQVAEAAQSAEGPQRGLVSARGYHAVAAQAAPVDVWQWKAVRLAPFGQLDDSHFGPPYLQVPGERRYTAGYRADPDWSGGYADNWQWLGDGRVVPKRLPRDPDMLRPFQRADAAALPWGLSWYDTVPYDAAQDLYPVGTRMPSVLWKTVLEGDRGDVQGQAQWAAGRWTLEVRRGLQAPSRHDVTLADGVYLWVAVFDHAQTRHSYHLRPLRLRFAEAL